MDTADRFRGCLLGLAVGDTVGTTLEFKPPGSFRPTIGMAGAVDRSVLIPGEWTDDTEKRCVAVGFSARNTRSICTGVLLLANA